MLGVGGGYALLSGGEAEPVVSSILAPTVPESLEPQPTQPEPTGVVTRDTASGAAADSLAAPPARIDTGMAASIAVADTGLLGRTIIAVADLPVVRVADVAADGRAGYQVVQTLQSGERLTVTVLPWRAADSVRLGPVRPRDGGISEGSVRFGRYVVDVSGRVSPGAMRDLLGRLIGRREPGR